MDRPPMAVPLERRGTGHGGRAQPPCLHVSLASSAWHPPSGVWLYGIGGLGTGATPQIAEAQGGRSGVGMRNAFPWVAAEPPVRHVPVNLSRSGYVVVNPSVRVCRKTTSRPSS